MGKKTGNACETPNRIGKSNIINYGSLEPPQACHRAVRLQGPAGRGRHRGPGARVAGACDAPRGPGGKEPPEPAEARLAFVRRDPRSAGRAGGPQGRTGQVRGREAGVTRGTPIWPGLPPAPAAAAAAAGPRWAQSPGPWARAAPSAPPPGRVRPCSPFGLPAGQLCRDPGSLRAGRIKGASALRRNCEPGPPTLTNPTYCFVFVLFFGSISTTLHKVGKPTPRFTFKFVCVPNRPAVTAFQHCNPHRRHSE